MDNEEKTSSRIRSPKYPVSSLRQAIEDAEVLYSKDKTMSIHQETAAKHLGYAKLHSGAAARRLSALKQYGLADFPQAGKIKLSDLYIRYKFSKDSNDASDALRIAFFNAPLFKEIIDTCGGIDNVPSDQTLTSMLVREKQFNPDSVDLFISNFRDSVNLLKEKGASAPSDDSSSGPEKTQAQDNNQRNIVEKKPTAALNIDGSFEQFPIRLPNNRRAILLLPKEFYEEDKEFIKKNLDVIWCPSKNE